jgi:hypothetical protein
MIVTDRSLDIQEGNPQINREEESMKTNMRKIAAWMLALLLVIYMVPVSAESYTSNEVQTDAELVAALEIINNSGPSLFVGKTITLALPEGYETAEWTSSDNDVATVKDGVVTGVNEGTVTITVTSNGKTNSTNIDVIAPKAQATEEDESAENDRTMTIIINGSKIKTQYDGQPHVVEYTYSADNEDFNPDLIIWKKEATSRTEAGATKPTLTADDFEYGDESYDVNFQVKDGSVWITPIEATVKADDVEISVDELATMNLTATVTGVLEGDTLEYELNWPEEYKVGEYEIVPTGDKKQSNYAVTFEKGKLTVKESDGSTQKLYNFLKMDNDSNYYRLKITSIIAEPYEKLGTGKTLNADQYTISSGDYDFSNLILTVNGEEYKFSATQPTGDFESCYTIQSVKVSTNNRVTGQDSWFNNPNGYLDGSEEQYKALGVVRTDPGYHRDYMVKLYKGKPIIPMSIHITSSIPSGEVVLLGTEITLTAELTGFEGKNYKLQWQHSTDRQNWVDQEGANDLSYTYMFDEETIQYIWRAVAVEVE